MKSRAYHLIWLAGLLAGPSWAQTTAPLPPSGEPSALSESYVKLVAPQIGDDVVLDGAMALSETLFVVRAGALTEAQDVGVAPPGWFVNEPYIEAAQLRDASNEIAVIEAVAPPLPGAVPIVLSRGLGGVAEALRLVRFDHDLQAANPKIAMEATEVALNVDAGGAAGATFLIQSPPSGAATGPLVNGCGEVAGFMLDADAATALGFSANPGQSVVLGPLLIQQAVERAGATVAVAAAACATPFAPVTQASAAQAQTSATPAWQTEVGEAQELLGLLGFYSGPVDDTANPELQAAIRGFQALRGLPNTGNLDPGFLDALRAEAAQVIQAQTQTAPQVQAPAAPAQAAPAIDQVDAEILGRIEALTTTIEELQSVIDVLEEREGETRARNEALVEAVQGIVVQLATQAQTIDTLSAAQAEYDDALSTLLDEIVSAAEPDPSEAFLQRVFADPILAGLTLLLLLLVAILLTLLFAMQGIRRAKDEQTTYVVAPVTSAPLVYVLSSVDDDTIDVELDTVSLEGPGIILGRGQEADLAVSHGSISRQHARLSLADGRLWLEDLGSGNGTTVDGRRLVPHGPTEVAVPGQFTIGSFRLRVTRG